MNRQLELGEHQLKDKINSKVYHEVEKVSVETDVLLFSFGFKNYSSLAFQLLHLHIVHNHHASEAGLESTVCANLLLQCNLRASTAFSCCWSRTTYLQNMQIHTPCDICGLMSPGVFFVQYLVWVNDESLSEPILTGTTRHCGLECRLSWRLRML